MTKLWLMFLRTPFNVMNDSLNYTPVGAVRALKGSTKGPGPHGERHHYTQEGAKCPVRQERHRCGHDGRRCRAVANGLMDVTFKGPDDGEKSASGFSAARVRSASASATVRGAATATHPLLVPLAIVGHVVDAARYGKDRKTQLLESRIADALSKALIQAAFEASPLTTLNGLLSTATGKGDSAGIERALTGLPANAVILGNRLFRSWTDRSTHGLRQQPVQADDSIPAPRRRGTERRAGPPGRGAGSIALRRRAIDGPRGPPAGAEATLDSGRLA